MTLLLNTSMKIWDFDLPNSPTKFTFLRTEFENRNIISTTYRVNMFTADTQKKKIKINKTHHCKINTFIALLRIIKKHKIKIGFRKCLSTGLK